MKIVNLPWFLAVKCCHAACSCGTKSRMIFNFLRIFVIKNFNFNPIFADEKYFLVDKIRTFFFIFVDWLLKFYKLSHQTLFIKTLQSGKVFYGIFRKENCLTNKSE